MGESGVRVASARRSQRFQIAIPVIVRGADFRETTSTVSVNAYEGFVMLKATVARGDLIWLINPKTAEELPAKVISLDNPEDGKIPVAVEFSFPPDDWHTSAERKRPGSNRQPK